MRRTQPGKNLLTSCNLRLKFVYTVVRNRTFVLGWENFVIKTPV